jgi:hypothetical protein
MNATFKFENTSDANATVQLLEEDFKDHAAWTLSEKTISTSFSNDVQFGQFIFYLEKRALLNDLKFTWSKV